MIKTVIALIIITFAFAGPTLADEIFLTGGESAFTSILDTAGCSVAIMRNGNRVSIKKSLQSGTELTSLT